MDIVGTLIDWGDSLFAQDTMESVTEAGMLYDPRLRDPGHETGQARQMPHRH